MIAFNKYYNKFNILSASLVIISLLLTRNKDRGDAKNLVLSLNLYRH